MTPDDRVADPIPVADEEQPPELADWWVWGVRQVAAVVADLLLAARVLPLLFVLYKAILWFFTRESRELLELGAGVAAFFLLWGLGLLLGRFSAEREPPDAEGWLRRGRPIALTMPFTSRGGKSGREPSEEDARTL